MDNNVKRTVGAILVVGSILCLIVIYTFLDDILIPSGYDLAIDGFVLSKNLLLFLIFIMISKLGYMLLKSK